MSAPTHGDDPTSAAFSGPADLTARLNELTRRLDDLDARSEQRDVRIAADLATTLRALELIHDDDPGARRRLRTLRADADYARAFVAPDPLVTVVIPTWNRLDTLLDRAIPSALAQTHPKIEVIVVGDASPPDTEQAISALDDPRVTFQNLTIRGPYDGDGYDAWLASGTPGLNAGVAMASGLWIAPLGDDDEFAPQHVESLLREARARRLELVYSRGRVILPDGRETQLGEFPPRLTQIGLQSTLYHAGLGFIELELGHALFGTPNDWGLVRRMMRVGVRIGMLDEATVTYRPSLRAQTTADGRPVGGAGAPTDARSGDERAGVEQLERELAEQRALAADLSRRLDEVRRSRSWRLTAPLRRLRAR